MLDYLIKNALVLDGTGADAFPADIAVAGGSIQAVGRFPHAAAAHVLDAAGRCAAPGFLDIHRHADAACLRSGFGEPELRQGLTSIVNGNCGLSLAPVFGPHAGDVRAYLAPVTGEAGPDAPIGSMDAYLSHLESLDTALNLGMLAGGGTIRAVAAGYGAARLDKDQLQAVRRLLEQCLAGGALGVSLGLGYAPESFYTTAELIDALSPLAGGNIPITVHMRSEGDGMTAALEEMLTVARALRAPVHISHLKAIGRENWNRQIPQALAAMDRARQEGLDVSCDVYPYTAGSTQLIHILPPEFHLGGTAAMTERLRDPVRQERLRARLETGTDFENIVRLVGWENIRMSAFRLPENRALEGLSVAEAADRLGQEPLGCVCGLLAAERCGIAMIDFIASEEDLAAILRDPCSNVISDSTYPSQGLPHPRVYGTFVRVLERYVRQRKVLTLPQAVAKMTGVPARVLGLARKGRIAPGFDADLVLFDPAAVHEPGTYADPAQLARGMDDVFVNGVPVIAHGVFTDARPGKVMRREAIGN